MTWLDVCCNKGESPLNGRESTASDSRLDFGWLLTDHQHIQSAGFMTAWLNFICLPMVQMEYLEINKIKAGVIYYPRHARCEINSTHAMFKRPRQLHCCFISTKKMTRYTCVEQYAKRKMRSKFKNSVDSQCLT